MIYRNEKSEKQKAGTIRRIRCEAEGLCVAIIAEEIPGHWEKDEYLHSVYRAQVLDTCERRSRKRSSFVRYTSHGSYHTLLEAKKAVEKWFKENQSDLHLREHAPVRCLTAGDGSAFYPTPPKMAGIMLSRVDWSRVRTILEPSAGKGDLVEAVKSALAGNEPGSSFYGRRDHRGLKIRGELYQKKDIDVVEIDENLQQILIGKGFHLVHDDFLTYATQKVYDLILMNPPFQDGDKHLLKAISMIEDTGGQLVCLLNAETIRNQYTNSRYMLAQRLREFDARIEFFPDAFKHAERKTDVEIAMVTIDIPAKERVSHIWEGMKKARVETGEQAEPEAIVSGNWIEQMVAEHEMEADAGVTLLREYGAMIPYIMSGGDTSYASPLIRVSVGSEKDIKKVDTAVINEYLSIVRTKYWQLLLNRPEINQKMTSEMSKQYHAKLNTLAGFGFTKFNIRRFILELSAQLNQGVIDSIHSLFHQLSEKYSWMPESEKNIHYYNGWSTNKAHKVGMKAIIPVDGFSSHYHYGSKETKELDTWHIKNGIQDLEKALTYLDSGKHGICRVSIDGAVERAIAMGKTAVSFTYFDATFYKKGTCHIKFNPEARPLIDRMNIMVGREKAWLPPCYGKVAYDDMDDASRAVVDSFQTKAEYEAVCAEPEYYLTATAGFPALTT